MADNNCSCDVTARGLWPILVLYKTKNECFYSCNGKNQYFYSVKDGMFYHENNLTIALINIHYLYNIILFMTWQTYIENFVNFFRYIH